MSTVPEVWPLDRIREDCERVGAEFFTYHTAKPFFRGEVHPDTFTSRNGLRVYFVSSEQFDQKDGTPGPRRFTLRAFYPFGSRVKVDTVGPLQRFKTYRGARQAAMRLATSVWQPTAADPDALHTCCAKVDGRQCWRRAEYTNGTDRVCSHHVLEQRGAL